MRALSLLLFPSLAFAGQFKVPDGWVDLTPGVASPENRATIDPEQLASIDKLVGQAAFFAGDVARRSPGFATNVIAVVRREPTQVNRLTLLGFAEGMSIVASRDGLKNAVLDSKIVDFDGVSVMRVVMKSQESPRQLRGVCYLLPMGERTAVLTFTTEAARLAEYEPIFDAAARATTGLAAAPAEPGELRVKNPKLVGAIVGGLVIVVAAVFLFRRRRS